MRITRRRLGAALAPVACGAGAALVVGALAGGAAAPHPGSRLAAVQSARSAAPLLANCFGHGQVRPSSITLSCADGYSSLTGIQWRSWQNSAYGRGTWLINDCVPFCARGTMNRFPAVVVLSAPRHVGHAAGRQYTRLTMTLPGNRCYTAAGQRACYPATTTRSLLPSPHTLPPPVMSVQEPALPLPAR
jgi:hypothetical protein